MTPNRRAAAVIAIYAALALLVVPVFPHFPSPNETTRWALVAAVVERGSLEISKEAALLGPSFEDVSEKDGRLYSNKAPGAALVALPGYLAVRPFVGPPSPRSLRPALVAMRLVAATLPALLLALAFVRVGERLGGWSDKAPIVVFALLFATPVCAYGLLLFSHVLVACALFLAWALLFVPELPRRAAWHEVAAGALLGLAVISEYTAAVPAVVLVTVAMMRRTPGALARLALGGLPFAIALGAYDVACFGGVFEVSSAHERDPSFRQLAKGGTFGVGIPTAAGLFGLLADPSKGLLVLSPFLLLVPRAASLAARVLPQPSTAAYVLAGVSLLLLYAGYPNWHGGFTVGARYLVPAIPLALLPLFFRGGGRLEAFLLGASACAVGLTTLVFPFVPPGVPLPWASFAWPILKDGLVAPNLLHLLGRPLAVAVPFLLVAAAAAFAFRTRHLPFTAGGAIAMLAAGLLLAGTQGPRVLVQRAYVEDVYFERTGTLEEAIGTIGLPQPRLLARRARDLTLPPASWPFAPPRREH